MNEIMTVEATISHLPPKAAKMVAVEVLLESCLYILRERLRETD